EVGELYGVLDDEHREREGEAVIVAAAVIIFRRETAHVDRRILRTTAPDEVRESYNHRRLHAGFLQEISLRLGAHRIGELNDAVDADPARMHDLLRNPFPVEMGLFAVEMRVLKEAWPPASGAQGLFVVSDFVPRILPHWFPTVADLVLLQL